MRKLILLACLCLTGCESTKPVYTPPPADQYTTRPYREISTNDLCYPGTYSRLIPPPKLQNIPKRVYAQDPETLNLILLGYISMLRDYNSARNAQMKSCQADVICIRVYK